MDERNDRYPNRNNFNYDEGKLRPRNLWQRYRLQIIIILLVILVIAFAATSLSLLLNRPSNTTATGNTQGTRLSSTPTVQAIPTPTATSGQAGAATPTSAPTSPVVQTQTLPCTVNLSTWTDGSADWKVLNGTLLNDGTNGRWNSGGGPTIVAPCDTGSTTNYAVEAKIQVTSSQYYACFGISTRGNPLSAGWQGYKVGVGDCGGGLDKARVSGPDYYRDSQIKDASFNPGTTTHTYRVEVKDNTIKFFIDNGLILSLIDNRYLTGSEVGLWSQNVQLTVLSLKVTAL